MSEQPDGSGHAAGPSDSGVPALVARLVARLPTGLVHPCAPAHHDPRTDAHVSGRPVGRPLAWATPTGTEDVVALVRAAAEEHIGITAVGAATTFWDGLRVEGVLALDTLGLRTPFVIDRDARLAHVGAGFSVREVDQAARRVGLCVASRPDAAGDTPIGSVLAVGSTSGLGMGFGLAVDQIAGATGVTGAGEVVRFGTSHMLHGVPNCPHGMPHALGLLSAAEGRGAIVTEVGVLLRPAPFVTATRSTRRALGLPTAEHVVSLLGLARTSLDSGALDSFRVEYGAGASPGRVELMARTYSVEDPRRATAAAEALVRSMRELGYAADAADAADALLEEPEGARLGRDPEYEFHWSFPVARHRARLLGSAFWGAEITAPWGSGLLPALEAALGLFESLADVTPTHRRFAVYPGNHLVSVGVHVLVAPDPQRIAATIAILEKAGAALLRYGVPYRIGSLWRRNVDAHFAASGAVAGASQTLVDALFRAMDPDAIIGSPARFSSNDREAP